MYCGGYQFSKNIGYIISTFPFLSCAFQNFRSFSRLALLLFRRLSPVLAHKRRDLEEAASNSSCSFLEALELVELYVNEKSATEREIVAITVAGLFPDRIRTTSTYSVLMWFTMQVRSDCLSKHVSRNHLFRSIPYDLLEMQYPCR